MRVCFYSLHNYTVLYTQWSTLPVCAARLRARPTRVCVGLPWEPVMTCWPPLVSPGSKLSSSSHGIFPVCLSSCGHLLIMIPYCQPLSPIWLCLNQLYLSQFYFQIRSHSELLVTRSPASSVRGVVAETRQIHTDYRVLWGKRDGWATLSRGKCPDPCLDRLLLA